MNIKLKRNISIGYAYNFFLQLNITSAIWVLYLSFKGMTLAEIGILESLYHITGLLLELPSGALADLKGRKFCVVAGRVVELVSCYLMMTSNSFFGFAVSFILSSAAMNLNSGAAEALIYDSLKELGEEEKYKKIWGQLVFAMSIAQGVAVLLGGILADVRFLYAYMLGMVVQTVALLLSIRFTEPPIHNKGIEKDNEKNEQEKLIIKQVKTSISVIRKRKIVLYIILFSALLGSLQTTVFFYSQKYFFDIGFTKTMIAVICATGSLIEAISSKYAYILESRLKLKGTLITVSSVNIFALAGLTLFKDLSVFFYLLTAVSGGLAFTILSDYINTEIPSEYRATILSFDSLCFSIFMICIFPLFGLTADYAGFSATFGVTAIIYIPIMVFLINKLLKQNRKDTAVSNSAIS
ncbi:MULTISPECIES: MFS transporter [unclassified Sedimentibacter]|uniref:MFS transporter n=1 Tax=unclassified Sedimentibacter TaxID=2649220 RepID=UPI0027E05576|nr:MFS transporter [Sedimentibacter sp. MB35-C1]WMJ78702.1 MFS transporter [Sedimentibacter sp. MB35-C1]